MKILKKFSAVLLALTFTLFLCVPFYGADAAYKTNFEIMSRAAYMINTDTGTVIYEKNPDEPFYPASLTKIMTTAIAIEYAEKAAKSSGVSLMEYLENTVVTTPSYIYDEFQGLSVSHADIYRNERVRMIDLLYAIMLPSACEASSSLADYIGNGQISVFVDMMNAKARELGAVNTHFENAHGLYHENQVTTAKDMYLITKYALSLDLFEQICTTVDYQMPATNVHAEPYYISHSNYMLSKNRGGTYYDKRVRGIKTGSLPEVGKNLVSMASDNGYNYLLVTLSAPDVNREGQAYSRNHFDDAKALYDWAFSSFSLQKMLKEGESKAEIKVRLSGDQDHVILDSARDVTILLPSETDTTSVQEIIELAENVQAPIQKGDVLGKLVLKQADDVIDTVDLVARENVDRSLPLYLLDATGRFFEQSFAQAILIGLGILLLLYIFATVRYNRIKRRRMMRERRYRQRP